MRSPLSAMSARLLRQESIPSDYLRQATCVTLGVMLNFDATQHFAAKRRTQQTLYEVTFTQTRLDGLGWLDQRHECLRHLGTAGQQPTKQLQRIDGGLAGSAEFSGGPGTRSFHSNTFRQCHDRGLHQQVGIRECSHVKTHVSRVLLGSCARVTLSARHVRGVDNGRADYLSRVLYRHEWQIHPALFHMLDQMWGPHTVDRFASEGTTLLPRYEVISNAFENLHVLHSVCDRFC